MEEVNISDMPNIPQFVKLDGVETYTATSCEDYIKNVKENVAKDYKSMAELPEFMKIKPHNHPIGLIGGGPSIKKELDRIRDFQLAGFPIIACGSVHDYLQENGIIPTYCTVCDPDPLSILYLQKKNKDTKYLIAISCDPKIFEYLSDQDVYAWNCHSDDAHKSLEGIYDKYVGIMGGCTVGLRSIPIALMLGYTNHHMWGFDSCMGSSDEHHAYEFATDQEEVGVTYPIKFGMDKPLEGGKVYICSGYQLAQAWHFHKFLVNFGNIFTPTFHGEGMLGDFYRYLREQANLNSEQKAA